MSNNKQLQTALEIAVMAHKGVTRRNTDPYIFHVLRVANNAKYIRTKTQKAAGILHDVIEDTELTLEDLHEYEFSKEVIEAVDIITKKKGEDYQSYLNSVKKNKLARAVKLADLRHNSDLTRLTKVTEKDIERKEKYQRAIDFLNS